MWWKALVFVLEDNESTAMVKWLKFFRTYLRCWSFDVWAVGEVCFIARTTLKTRCSMDNSSNQARSCKTICIEVRPSSWYLLSSAVLPSFVVWNGSLPMVVGSRLAIAHHLQRSRGSHNDVKWCWISLRPPTSNHWIQFPIHIYHRTSKLTWNKSWMFRIIAQAIAQGA